MNRLIGQFKKLPVYNDDIDATQKAWLQYREVECEAQAFENCSGSIYPIFIGNCCKAITRDRIETLKSNDRLTEAPQERGCKANTPTQSAGAVK